jgi:hypothetical protein
MRKAVSKHVDVGNRLNAVKTKEKRASLEGLRQKEAKRLGLARGLFDQKHSKFSM